MKTYSMIQECTASYSATERKDGGVAIRIEVPTRFADLWLVKLSELQTNDTEIAQYEKGEPHLRLS